MQIACDAVTKICYSLCVCAGAPFLDSGQDAGDGARTGNECVIATQGRRARTHTRTPLKTQPMPKRKIGPRQRTSYEMRFRTNHILYLAGDGREGKRNVVMEWRGTSGTRDFTVNFVISLRTDGVAEHASRS